VYPVRLVRKLLIVYFFPQFARLTLRLFKQYQKEEGEIPFALGKIGDLPDIATPRYFWQISLNGTCYVDMIDRLWQRTGDDGILDEFYESMKLCNTFTANLKTGPGGVISMPEIGGMEWFEGASGWACACTWAGCASHNSAWRSEWPSRPATPNTRIGAARGSRTVPGRWNRSSGPATTT